MWKYHRNTMISRIKAGKAYSKEHPADLEMIKAIQTGSREALSLFKRLTEKQFQRLKKLMTALEPLLPEETMTIWKFLETVHEIL
jgi:DNA-directed RNA polymerase subunit L